MSGSGSLGGVRAGAGRRMRLGARVATGAAALALAAVVGVPAGPAAAQEPAVAVVTPRDGVRELAGMRMTAPRDVPTWTEARAELGSPRSLRRDGPACTATYPGGVELLFASFGGALGCGDRALQAAYVRGRGAGVRVGSRTYRVGMRASELPRDARRLPRSWGGGVELASMPFIGDRTPTVIAHADQGSPRRVARLYLFVGGAGD